MTVRRVLASKNVEGVHTIPPDSKVSDAVAELGARRIGALVVSADGKRPDGILSERDIVRELGRGGGSVLDMAVSELMTKDVQTCTPDDAAQGVMRTMTVGRFRHMPVVDGDGSLVGVVSLGDVVKMRLEEVKSERDAMESMIAGNMV
jgi:CBS domain-containing protein